jgi:predicted lysophospholipase L1 biosynthesis ABC-type transport system permease subunit
MVTGIKTGSWVLATACSALPLCALAWWMGGSSWLAGAAVGAAVAVANAWMVGKLTERLVEKVHHERAPWQTALAFVLKTSLLLLLVYLVLLKLRVSPLGFAIGITSFVVGFVTFGLVFKRAKEEGYAPR